MITKIKEFFSAFGPISVITVCCIVVIFTTNAVTGWGPGGDKAPGGANAPAKPTVEDTSAANPATSDGSSSSSGTDSSTTSTTTPNGTMHVDDAGNLVDETGKIIQSADGSVNDGSNLIGSTNAGEAGTSAGGDQSGIIGDPNNSINGSSSASDGVTTP